MAITKNIKISQTEISQEIDLKDLGFNINDSTIKYAIAQSFINKIIDRTLENKDRFGKPFKKYSKSYINSLDFQSFGKSASDVNLKLTGEMLDSIEVLSTIGSKLVIGIKGDNAAKAYGHIKGMQGHPTLEGKTPIRDFFGVTENDVSEVKKEFRDTSPNETSVERSVSRKLLDFFARFQNESES